MLYTLITWNILLASCSFTGLWLLGWLKVSDLISPAERLILAAWSGLALQCLAFLTLALFIPLNPVGQLLILASCLVPLLHWLWRYCQLQNRRVLRHQLQNFWTWLGLPLLLIEIVWVILSSRPINWYDTGVYHLGAIHWLSNYGFVPGLSLINPRLGFISSWFAFSAAITPEFLADRIGAVSNSFLIVLVAYTLLILFRKSRNEPKPWPFSSIFLAIYLVILTLAYIYSQVTGREILTSFSHDMPVNYMVGIVLWSILMASRLSNNSTLDKREQHWRLFTIPLGLACIVVTMKMTGLFLIPTVLSLFLFKVSSNLKKINHWLMGIGLTALLLLPLASAQIVTSGCLLYPSQSLCLPLPWTVPAKTITNEAEMITRGGLLSDVAEKNQPTKASNQRRLAKIANQVFSKKLLLGKRDDILSPLLLGLSWVLGINRLLRREGRKPGDNWVLISGIVGSCFIVALNPQVSFRFGIGILLIVPTYCIAANLAASKAGPTFLTGWKKPSLAMGLIGLVIVFNLNLIHNYFLLPPPPSTQPDLARATSNQIDYYYVNGGDYHSCWYAPLPCSPGPLNKQIHLRDPSLNLRGGFIYRRDQAEAKL